MTIRFDYFVQENNTVDVTMVREEQDRSTRLAKFNLTPVEWESMYGSIEKGQEYYPDTDFTFCERRRQ